MVRVLLLLESGSIFAFPCSPRAWHAHGQPFRVDFPAARRRRSVAATLGQGGSIRTFRGGSGSTPSFRCIRAALWFYWFLFYSACGGGHASSPRGHPTSWRVTLLVCNHAKLVEGQQHRNRHFVSWTNLYSFHSIVVDFVCATDLTVRRYQKTSEVIHSQGTELPRFRLP